MKEFFRLLTFWLVGLISSIPVVATAQWNDSLSVKEKLEILAEVKPLDSAIVETQKLLETIKDKPAPIDIQRTLYQLSHLSFMNNDASSALRYVLEYNAQLPEENRVDRKRAWQLIGDIYNSEKLYETALSYYRKALYSIDTQEKDVLLMERMGDAFAAATQVDSAIVYYGQLRGIYRKTKAPIAEMNILQKLALMYTKQKKYERAIVYYTYIETTLKQQGKQEELGAVYNNIGYQYHLLGIYDKALEYFKMAAEECKVQSCNLDEVILYTNMGVGAFNQNHYDQAVIHLEKALGKAQKQNNYKEVAVLYDLLATSYLKREDLYLALKNNGFAKQMAKDHQLASVLKDVYQTEGLIREKLYEYDKAIVAFKQHLALRDSLRLVELIDQEKLRQQQFLLERSEKEIKLLLVNQRVQKLAYEQLQLQADNLDLERVRSESELARLRAEQEIKEERLLNQELAAQKAKQALSLAQQRLQTTQKDKEISELRQKEELQELQLMQKEAEEKERRQEIELLNEKQKTSQLEIERQQELQTYNNRVILGLSFLMIAMLAAVVYGRKLNLRLNKQKKEIERQKAIVEEERSKSDALLLNMLPRQTALELINDGKATPKFYDKVSVLFADFEGFTRISQDMSASDLINELNECFLAFDEICEKYNLEKIKTIGDAYMCAAGIPDDKGKYTYNAICAGFEMIEFIENRYQQKKKEGRNYWRLRVGVNTGPVIAGVVGKKKFAFDIWGDTVNTASRMESNSVPGKITISKATYHIVKDDFKCSPRGQIQVKNKKSMFVYFVDEHKRREKNKLV